MTNTQPSGADALRAALGALVSDIESLVDETQGVYGLHMNGDPSPWCELLPGGRYERLSALDDARAALSAAQEAPAEEVEALNDMLSDARLQLDMLREALGVKIEPHQSLFERMIDAARGAQAVPQGFVMVPKEPTPEMLQIGRHAAPYRAVDVYRAMLAAAPAAPAAPSDEHVSVVGMPEFDTLIDHIYEHGTTSEGVVILADALARALLSRYGRHAGNAQPAASAEPVLRIYAEGSMRSVTEWLDGARDLTDGDHTLYAAPVAAQNPDDALDAARYRWLRTRWGRIADEYDGDSDQLVAIREADSHFEGWDVDPLSLDRAIDAAMKGQGHA